MKNIAIIDYKTGNIGSIANMIEYLGCNAKISKNINDISAASHLVLPGVGTFDKGMNGILENKLIDLLNEQVLVKKKPILGICLGMQLMCNHSTEGSKNGLSWIDAEVEKFELQGLKIPHMGWNYVKLNKNSKLLKGFVEDPRFYFVHSYFVGNVKDNALTATCNYGLDFNCLIEKENIFATQFHPEKSHKFGMKLFENFIKL